MSKFGDISFQEYVTEGISHPFFYGDLVYKLRRVKWEANFVSSGSKIVKRLWCRKYDPVIIERTKGFVLCPSTALYRSFLKHCTLTNKAVGNIWRDLSKLPQRRQGPDLVPSDCYTGLLSSLDLSSLPYGRSIAYSGRCLLYIVYCFYHLACLCNNFYGLSSLVRCWYLVFIRRIIYYLHVYPFNYMAIAVSWKVGIS